MSMRRASIRGNLRRLGAALLCASLMSAAQAGSAPTLKAGVFNPPRQAPDFSLDGSDGRKLSLGAYRGKVVILGFGYTSCPNVCPTTLATLAQTRRKLGADAVDVQVLYVTVDPQRDVVERMKNYLATFDPTFVGGTGADAALASVRQSYGIVADKHVEGGHTTYAHSSYTYLIDRSGNLRALMPYGHGPDDYVHDLQILLRE
jgi:protein SCO1/2